MTMSKQNKRRNFDSNFKVKVAIEAIQEKLTMAEIASKYEIFPSQVTDWKKEFLAGASSVFENTKGTKGKKVDESTALYEQIGRLQMDLAFLKKKLS
jgi:transposase-like protein